MKYFGIVVLLFSVVNAKKSVLPAFIKPCSLTGDVSKCIAENIELCRPYFFKGIPKLGVPPLSPFIIPEVSVRNNDLKITARNLTMFNIENVVVKNLVVNATEDTFTVDLYFPKLLSTFGYQVQGRLLLLQLNGQGNGNISLTGILTHSTMKGERVMKDNKEYVNYKTINVEIEVDDGSIYMENIFGPREDLTVNTNRLINENFKEFFVEVMPLLKDAVGEFILNIAKNVFSIPLSDLFPN